MMVGRGVRLGWGILIFMMKRRFDWWMNEVRLGGVGSCDELVGWGWG